MFRLEVLSAMRRGGDTRPVLIMTARDAIAGSLRPQRVDLPSRLWSHPTLWAYVRTGVRRGVW